MDKSNSQSQFQGKSIVKNGNLGRSDSQPMINNINKHRHLNQLTDLNDPENQQRTNDFTANKSSVTFKDQSLTQKYEQRKQILINHYNQLMEKNTKFFNHVSGDDICGLCNCGQCKCQKINVQLDYKKGGDSTYQHDFNAKQSQISKMEKEFYTKQFYNKQSIELKTINRTDYQPHQVNPFVMSHGQRGEEKFLPFSGVSSYNHSFVKFPNNPMAQIKPPAHPTVIKDMKFVGKTSYNQNYLGKQVPFDPELEFIKNQNKRGFFKSPMNPEFPFLGETTNQFTYQPFKTKKFSKGPVNQNYQSLPAFEGQFKSTIQADFDDKKKFKCPARLILHETYKQQIEKDSLNQQ